ncbi:MAG: T9SS type A sorting domain-containing protein, partial [Saprospiraceae bacterium]
NEIYFCHDGGLNKYDENTESWEELSNGLPITQFYKMAISTTTPPTLIGGSQDNGGFIKRSNGTWGNTNGGDAMWQLLDPTNSKIGYTEYWGGRAVYRTTDNFNNLTDLHANIPGEPQGQWVTPFNLNPQNPKTFIIGYNDVFISPDRGNTFFPISNNLTGAEDKDFRNVDMSPVDTNIIMASYSNLLFYTYNYGKTWNKSTLATSFEISSIEFHPQDSNRLWVTRSGLGTFKVQESIDKGKTWKNLTSNFVNTPALIIRFDQASNSLFVGTDIGLFYSDADKINWQYYGNGLPNTSVTDIELHQATRKMYISTYGRGFYSIDLPSCAPAVMTVQSKLNTKSFAYADSIKICLGDEVILKSHIDNLQGSYHWRGPRNFDTIITNTNLLNLGAFKSISKTGNYSLEFVSEKLCTRIDSIYIKVNALPSTQIISDFPELDCSHNQVTLSNSSLNSSNQYQWSMNGKSISDSSNITISNAATYVLKITNSATSCSSTDTISINQVLPPEISYTSQNVECYGEKTGSIDLKIKGGTQPYSLVYSNPILLNGFNNLPAGEYIIIITDSKNCNWRDTIRIKENTQLKAQFPVKDAAVSDGSITSIIQGGVPPYKYEWSKNGITISNEPDLKDLESGFYKLIITDSLNCFKSFDSIEVKQVTSVSENKLTDFIIYPNPTKDYLTISSISHSHLNVDIEICNISGSNYFFKKKIKNAEFEKINLSFLNSGTYILKIKSGHKVFEHKIEIVH